MAMKKINAILLLFFCLFFVACDFDLSDKTVYITYTGTKYHKGGCRYLQKSRIAIELKEARAKGYSRCSVCKP